MRIEISLQADPSLSDLKPIQVHWCKANGERQLLQSFSLNERAKAIEFCRSIAAYPDDEVVDVSYTNFPIARTDAVNCAQKS